MPMLKRRNLLSPVLILFALNGCAPSTIDHVTAISDYCRIAKPITYDGIIDTPATVRQVEAHNSVYECVCRKDCPASKR